MISAMPEARLLRPESQQDVAALRNAICSLLDRAFGSGM
jgi:hypothetical protein